MQIGLDLRFLQDDMYSQFVLQLVTHLINKEKSDVFVIYTNTPLSQLQQPHTRIKCVNIKNGGWKEQTLFHKILQHDNNDCVIFFNHFKPIFYKEFYFIVLSSLKDVYYQEFDSYWQKYKYLYLIEKNLKKAHKTICFDTSTKNELIERFNLREDKIEIMPWFFIEQFSENSDTLYDVKNLDIRVKYGLQNEFIMYSWEDSIEKNLEKLLYVLEKLDNKNLDLIFLGDKISKNIPLRNLIIKHNLQERVKFLWFIKEGEKKILYKISLWFVYPSLYETFPFTMGEALLFDVPIIASNLKSISHIFWDTITYFSPISKNSMLESLKGFINTKKYAPNYMHIKDNCNPHTTVESLLKIIK